MNNWMQSQAIYRPQPAPKPVGREIFEAVMGAVTPGALQVLRLSEVALASPTLSPQAKAGAELVGGLAILYFFIKLVEE
jgi:hypothetical protein